MSDHSDWIELRERRMVEPGAAEAYRTAQLDQEPILIDAEFRRDWRRLWRVAEQVAQDYEGNSIGLGIYLATHMIDAIRDLTPYDPPRHQAMWDRFMSCVVTLRRRTP